MAGSSFRALGTIVTLGFRVRSLGIEVKGLGTFVLPLRIKESGI